MKKPNAPQKSAPLLYVCTIVKNEEEMLPGMLASVRDQVDRIVVVDTGSTDRTRAIAEAAGALILDHVWDGDFSAARNRALDAVPLGAWVLALDADERLAPGGGQQIRAFMETNQHAFAALSLYNASRLDMTLDEAKRPDSGISPVLVPRLFKRDAELRWEGRIHEIPRSWSKKNRGSELMVPLLHLGYAKEWIEKKGKNDRNRKALEDEVVARPDSSVLRAYLAFEYYRAGNTESGWLHTDYGWQLCLKADRDENDPVINLGNMRTQALLEKGRIDEAEQTVADMRRLGQPHPNTEWLEGRCALIRAMGGDLSKVESGIAAYLRALGWQRTVFQEVMLEGVNSWRSTYELGLLLLLADRYADAGPLLAKAEQWPESRTQARFARWELFLLTGQVQTAFTQLQPLLSEAVQKNSPMPPDFWLLAALACFQLGAAPEAAHFAARAADAKTPWISRHRAILLEDLEQQLAPPKAPNRGAVLDALLAGLPTQSTEMPSDQAVDALVGELAEAGDTLGLAALMTRRAGALVPQLPARVLAALDDRGLQWTDDEPDFVLIGGAGRSGTTLFRAMLGAHPEIHCGPEAKLVPVMGDLNRQLHRGFDVEFQSAGIDTSLIDKATRAFLATFLRGLHPTKRIAEKTPPNLNHLALLGSFFPHARFIHILRDGRAVVESLLRQRWAGLDGKPLPYTQNTTLAARYWRETVQTIRRQAATTPGRFLEVRYEDLVDNPRREMERVLAFVGEPWDDVVLNPSATLSSRESSTQAVAKGLQKSKEESWRKLSASQLAEIEAEAGGLLRELGYTK